MASRKKYKKSKPLSFLITIVALLALIFSLFPNAKSFLLNLFEESRIPTLTDGELSVHFLDVDQGDSILILSPSGESMLIDTSISKMDDVIIEYLKSVRVNKLDYLVLTHPDGDHIGSASKILEEIGANTVFMTDITHTTKTYEKLLETIDKLDIPLKIPKLNDVINLGNARLTVLGPTEKSNSTNEMSLVMRLDYGEISFMLTGDAGKESEMLMLSEYSIGTFKSHVLKVGHHGSSNSSTKEFVSAVDPLYAIISCGKDNSFVHPHKDVIDLMYEMNIKYYITHESGHIVFSTDGEALSLLRPSV